MPKTPEPVGKRRRPLTIVSLIAAAVFLIAYGALGSTVAHHAQQGDFGCFYMGASLVRDGHLTQLYDYPTQTARWRSLISPDTAPVPYVRPPFYAVFQSVIAVWPLAASYWITTAASVLLVIGCWAWFGRRWGDDALILASMSFAPLAGISHGQDCALMLCFATASFWLFTREKRFAAGAVLALGLFKFHLLLLIGPLLLVTRRWRMFQGFAAIAAVEAGASFALVGTAGIRDYVALMLRRDLTPLYPMPEKMPNLTGLLANFQIESAPLVAAGTLLVVALALYAGWRAPWWRVFTAGVVASLLIIPHVFAYDTTVLIPGLLFGYAESTRKLTRGLSVWLCSPLPTLAVLFPPPWPAVLAASLLSLLVALAYETWQERRANASDQTPAALPVEPLRHAPAKP